MTPELHRFLSLCLNLQVLKFGEFELKSGRVSPFFFNAGLLSSAEALASLADLFAKRLAPKKPEVLFGAAYKGIPFVAATASCLYKDHDQNPGWGFNRKEAKTHGEGGSLVGASLEGKSVWVIDDVITAGTAVREVLGMLDQAGAKVAGICIALDRKERGQGPRSAIEELREQGYAVEALFSIDELIELVSSDDELKQHVAPMLAYRETYGV